MSIEESSFPTRVDHTTEVIDLKRERVNQICELIAAGCSRAEIKAQTNQFGLGYRAFDHLMRSAYNKVETVFQKTLGISVADLVGKLERVYHEAMQQGDLASANQAIKSLAALSGKTAAKVEVSVSSSKSLENLSDEELTKILSEHTLDVTPKS